MHLSPISIDCVRHCVDQERETMLDNKEFTSGSSRKLINNIRFYSKVKKKPQFESAQVKKDEKKEKKSRVDRFDFARCICLLHVNRREFDISTIPIIRTSIDVGA